MYLLGFAGGWPAQLALWGMTADALQVVDLPAASVARARDLMGKYADVPMTLADATLVAAAEQQGIQRVFTLDSDFLVYRFRGRRAFELIP